jgi:amidase
VVRKLDSHIRENHSSVAGPKGPALHLYRGPALRLSRRVAALLLIVASGLTAAPLAQRGQPPPPFAIEEATIATVHAAMRAKQLTCRALVDRYLARIAAYDKQGPALNAIVVINPKAQEEAGALDKRFAAGGLAGPLHCVPTIVKDNFETIGLQSAGGSQSLAGFVSEKDAFQVRRIKAAGAIVLAKSNMAEFAFSPYESLSSLQGHTKNPYALDRVPAGSSGGTAAAVAANFGLVGLGSDTGNSIRGPSAHNALAGIRSTMGLTSRAGVIPLSYLADIAGPMTRTLADAVAVFQVIVGEDPDDAMTALGRGRAIPTYSASLVRDGLKGARVGILRQAYERQTTDEEVVRIFVKAQDDMKAAGATIVDAIVIETVRRQTGVGMCRGFKYDIDEYLRVRGARAPVHSLDEIVASGKFHESVARRLQQAQTSTPLGPDSDACRADAEYRAAFGAALTRAMDEHTLDAFIYPTWSNPPRPIGDLTSPHGDNSQVHSPSSGFPAITVPMGYTRENTLPAGVTFLGRAWDEARLIRLAFAYEQATHHRRPPPSAPPR